MCCHEYEPSIERMLAEEIGRDERDRLLAHTERCSRCREFVDLHHRLMDPDVSADLPGDAEFAAMRRSVLDRVRDERIERRGTRWRGLADLFQLFALRPALAGGLAAVMLALLAAGVVVGRGTAPAQGLRLGGDSVARPFDLASERLTDFEDSPYVYSNVRFRDVPDGSVALSFDVTRRLELERRRDDPLVKQVLAQSLISDEPLGTRLQAVSWAGRVSDPVIEQALIRAMLDDEDLPVRMKALKILASYEPDEDIEAAFLMVLSGDPSVQLRMLALDYLAASQSVTPERLSDVMESLQEVEGDRALMVRASRYAGRTN